MNPLELIKNHLGADAWKRARRAWAEQSIIKLESELSVFSNYKIYLIQGDDDQFDFPSLPHCSYGYYAANGSEAVPLTRAGKEIQTILAREWSSLLEADPVGLASLILRFFDEGIEASHHVLADSEDLRSMCESPRGYRLDEIAFESALPLLGNTACIMDGEVLTLRAITLVGWMHMKMDLGIEILKIQRNGLVSLTERRILSDKIFTQVPGILY